ncbi:bzip transcription factor protein, partial [Alternaria burnsii]
MQKFTETAESRCKNAYGGDAARPIFGRQAGTKKDESVYDGWENGKELGTRQLTAVPTFSKKQAPVEKRRRELLSGLTSHTKERLKQDYATSGLGTNDARVGIPSCVSKIKRHHSDAENSMDEDEEIRSTKRRRKSQKPSHHSTPPGIDTNAFDDGLDFGDTNTFKSYNLNLFSEASNAVRQENVLNPFLQTPAYHVQRSPQDQHYGSHQHQAAMAPATNIQVHSNEKSGDPSSRVIHNRPFSSASKPYLDDLKYTISEDCTMDSPQRRKAYLIALQHPKSRVVRIEQPRSRSLRPGPLDGKKQIEELEEEKKQWMEKICQMQDDFAAMRIEYDALVAEKENWHRESMEMHHMVNQLQFDKEELVRNHTLETGELRKKVSVLTERLEAA